MNIGEASIQDALNLDENGSLTAAWEAGYLHDWVTYPQSVYVRERHQRKGHGIGMYRAWVTRGLPLGVAFVAGAAVGADTTYSAAQVWRALRREFPGGHLWVFLGPRDDR